MDVQSTFKIWDPNLTKHSPFGRVDARGVRTALTIASLTALRILRRDYVRVVTLTHDTTPP